MTSEGISFLTVRVVAARIQKEQIQSAGIAQME